MIGEIYFDWFIAFVWMAREQECFTKGDFVVCEVDVFVDLLVIE